MTFEQILTEAELRAEEDQNEAAIWLYHQLKELGAIERLKSGMYRVEDKKGNRISFKPNAEQMRYLNERKDNHFSLILKSRQIGFTTFAAVEEYDAAIFEGESSGIMANVMPNVEEIFQQKFKVIHDCFMEDWGGWFPLKMDQSSTRILRFKYIDLTPIIQLNTFVKVAHDFKGTTLSRLHLSEAAFMTDVRITEAIQCVPYSGRVTAETTPNGMGGWFFDIYQTTKNGKGKYKHFFAPWYLFYPEDDDPISEIDNIVYTADEQILKDMHGVSDRALLWRRNKIAELGDDENEFERLYPSDEDKCFLSGEDQVFTASLLNALHRKIRAPRIGELIDKGGHIKFVECAEGRFLIWNEPKAGSFYAIGGDTSEGVGKDATAAYAVNRMNGSFDGGIHGQLDVDEAAECLIKLATYYNYAFVDPEINNHGHAVVENMKKRGWRKFYKRRQVDSISGKKTSVIGFLTTKESKHRIIQNLKVALRNGSAIPLDPELIKEMSTYLCDQNGRLGAKSNCHDDRVMAAALAIEMINALPPPQDEKETIDLCQYDEITGMPL